MGRLTRDEEAEYSNLRRQQREGCIRPHMLIRLGKLEWLLRQPVEVEQFQLFEGANP